MRLKPKAPSANFPEDGDLSNLLDRVELAQNLTSLYSSLDETSVSILHGRWGVGKTTFAKRWSKQLEQSGFGVIYFDAFSHDYIGEPFDALMSAVIREGESGERNEPKFEKLKSRAAAVSRALAVTGVKAGVRIATLNAIDTTDIEALADAASGVSSDMADAARDAAKNLLERRATDLAAFEDFRLSLQEIHKISGSSDEDLPGSGKTIFIVDELDRCRPDFALELIESLKHFFRLEGLHFVLVTNRDYLARSVNARYGLGEKSDEYLQKFYDFTIHFEQAPEYVQQHAAAVFGRRIIGELLSGEKLQVQRQVGEYLAAFSVAFDLTLRQVEHIATNLALSYLALNDRTFAPVLLVTYLAFLKALHPLEYGRIKTKSLNYKDADALLEKGNWPEDFDGDRLRRLVRYHLDPDIDPNDPNYNGWGLRSDRFFFDRLDALPHVANSVMDQFSRT